MAAALSASPWGPSRAHGRGASLEKYSLCRRRVSLTAQGPRAAGLGACGAPAGSRWRQGPGAAAYPGDSLAPPVFYPSARLTLHTALGRPSVCHTAGFEAIRAGIRSDPRRPLLDPRQCTWAERYPRPQMSSYSPTHSPEKGSTCQEVGPPWTHRRRTCTWKCRLPEHMVGRRRPPAHSVLASPSPHPSTACPGRALAPAPLCTRVSPPWDARAPRVPARTATPAPGTHVHHGGAPGRPLAARLSDTRARAPPTALLARCPRTGTPTSASKPVGHTRGRTHSAARRAGGRRGPRGARRAPRGRLSAGPSARGSVVVNDAFDGGRICCARSERAPIIWKAEIRNTIYSAALWKQFPALYNPILGQPPGAGQITIGYSLSSPGTKISRPR